MGVRGLVVAAVPLIAVLLAFALCIGSNAQSRADLPIPVRVNLGHRERETQRRVAKLVVTLPPRAAVVPGTPPLPGNKAMLATARALAPAFCALYGQRDYFDREVIYREIFAQLAEDPTNLGAASRILTDPAFLRQAIGPKEQAVARVYAIHFLRHAADQGDMAPLVDTTRSLFAALDAHGEQARGQYRDVEALIRAVLESQYDPAELCQRPGALVREMLLADGQEHAQIADPELRQAIEAAFWAVAMMHTAEKETLDRMGRQIDATLRETR